jgi:hypothetical protein
VKFDLLQSIRKLFFSMLLFEDRCSETWLQKIDFGFPGLEICAQDGMLIHYASNYVPVSCFTCQHELGFVQGDTHSIIISLTRDLSVLQFLRFLNCL